MRINRYLASCGLGSRRATENLVRDGKVTVNGSVCDNLAVQVGAGDVVRVNRRMVQPEESRYLAFHKPPGILCTRSDEKKRPTIYTLLPAEFGGLNYVGRLDKESEGLLLLTNDGAFAERILKPRNQIEKEYHVQLDRPPEAPLFSKLTRGTVIDGMRAKALRAFPIGKTFIGIVLTQGLKRQIRIMIARFGYDVKSLRRVRVGPVTLKKLAPGAVRPLTRRELGALGGPVA